MANIGIYKITNKLNNEIYVGQSLNIFKRWAVHANPKVSPEMAITKTIRKNGLTNFTFEIVELCNREQLNEREVYWIKHFDSYRKGYNGTTGGDSREYSSSKIKETTTKEIQNYLVGDTYSIKFLSEMYQVVEGTIRAINTGDSWFNPELSYPIRSGKLSKQQKANKCLKCGKLLSKYTKSGLCVKHSAEQNRRSTRPLKPVLFNLLFGMTFKAVGEKFGVSDSAVRKWCKAYNLPHNKSSYVVVKWYALEDSNL